MLGSKTTYEIKHGITLNYMLLGLGLILVGVIFLLVKLYFVAPLFIVVGIVIFLSIKGMTINKEFDQLKTYYWFFGYKFGKTISIESYDVLVLTNHHGETMMNSRGRSSHIVTNSYALILMNNNNQKIELKEYEKYKEAKHYLNVISDFLKVDNVDKVKLTQNLIKKRGVRR